jgi:hypothetical protein
MSNSVGASFSQSATGKSGWSTGGLGDLVGYIPGIGFNILIGGSKSINGQPSLGGGIKGIMPQPIVDHDNSDEFAQTRFTLRDAWNTSRVNGSSNPKRMVGPFRAVNNAGDILSRQNYSCGGSCQTFQSRPGLSGLRQHFGSVSTSCTADVFHSANQVNPAVPASACNTKYVYDSSDYIRFRKNQAFNKNYNDRSFGGNDYSGAQTATRAIRRY